MTETVYSLISTEQIGRLKMNMQIIWCRVYDTEVCAGMTVSILASAIQYQPNVTAVRRLMH
jgi:hypothetical protein